MEANVVYSDVVVVASVVIFIYVKSGSTFKIEIQLSQ